MNEQEQKNVEDNHDAHVDGDINSLPEGHAQRPQRHAPWSSSKIFTTFIVVAVACIILLAFIKSNWSQPNPRLSGQPSAQPAATLPPESDANRQITTAQVDDKGGDWYIISNHTNKCEPDEGPAKMMATFKQAGMPYEVIDDVVEGGKPMQVRLQVRDSAEALQAVFYRGKARCQAQADKMKQSTDSELNRYK